LERISLAVRFLPDGSTGAALRVEIAERLMDLAHRGAKNGRRWWKSDRVG
jgi:hypothetical protein